MVGNTEHGMSRHVFYGSQVGAKLNSDIISGGGTDDTDALQAVLDKATSLGSVHLIIDGPALVRGLDIHSNTTIECLNPSCGFFLADESNRPILRNAHPSREHRQDRNIAILGGTYNHNSHGQVHHTEDHQLVVALGFFGVEQLTIRDITIRNQRTCAFHAANWFRVNMENVVIDLPDRVQAQNQDGIHFQGPGQFLTMRNIQGCAWDDFIALNADDGNTTYDASGKLVNNEAFGPYVGFGPITDVLIDGVLIDDAAQGIRLLSRASRLDRVVIRNVLGTYRSFGFYINTWYEGAGNFGNIVIDTVDLRQSKPNYTYRPPFLFTLGGRIENLTLRNISHHHPTDNRSLVVVEQDADIAILTLDGLHIFESHRESSDMTVISVDGKVDRLIVRNAHICRAPDVPRKGCLVGTTKGVHPHGIRHLFLNGISVNRMGSLLRHCAGEIGTIQVNNVACAEMADAIISVVDGNVEELRADATYGAKLLSLHGNGKVAMLAGTASCSSKSVRA